MRKKTTKDQYIQSTVRISNKGPYHSNKKDQNSNVNFHDLYRDNLELGFSEFNYFQCIESTDFYKKQHINQLLLIKDQQKIIDDLKEENERLESLNLDLQDDISNLQYDVNRLKNDIEDLNDFGKVKNNEIKELNSKIRRIKRIIK